AEHAEEQSGAEEAELVAERRGPCHGAHEMVASRDPEHVRRRLRVSAEAGERRDERPGREGPAWRPTAKPVLAERQEPRETRAHVRQRMEAEHEVERLEPVEDAGQ